MFERRAGYAAMFIKTAHRMEESSHVRTLRTLETKRLDERLRKHGIPPLIQE